jgi:hypothetical protein
MRSEEIALINLTLHHFETIAQIFIGMMVHPIARSLMWERCIWSS